MARHFFKTAAQFLATALTMWFVFTWLGARNHFLSIWPLTAVQLSLLLGEWSSRRDRVAQLIACAGGELLAASLLGMPFWIGAAMTAVQTMETGFSAALLTPAVVRFDDLKKRENVVRFGLIAFSLPLAAVALVARPVSALTHQSAITTWLLVAPSDVLGVAILLPPLLFLFSGEYRSISRLRPHFKAGIPVLLVFLGAVILIFTQNSKPFVSLLFPPMMAVLFVLGLEGGAFASLAVALIGSWATAHGRGPVWMTPGTSLMDRTLVLQVFLGAVVSVALPIGALLDQRRQAERAAREAQSIYSTLIENADDMIILSTLDGARRFVSPGVARVTGWSAAEYLALGHLGAMHPKDRDHAQTIIESLAAGKLQHVLRYRILCNDRNFRWVEASVHGYSDPASGRVAGYVATVRDISTMVENEAAWIAERASLARENHQLAELASRDELTGIANRRSFNRALDLEAARQSRSAKPLSLLMIDVDHFKKYNDLYGHPRGDLCLRQLAKVLQSSVGRASDLVARVGGEEFAVLLPGADEVGARRVSQEILKRLYDLVIEHAGCPWGRVSVSIGVATWPSHQRVEVAQLIQQADRALYESKSKGRNRISFENELIRTLSQPDDVELS